LIDADDTLWENNIYFERAISNFISYLDHHVHTPEQVRSHLNGVEHETIRVHGYGMETFHRSLVTCFEQLTEAPLTTRNRDSIQRFAWSIAEATLELLPGVEETLADLSLRHTLTLVTKGNLLEQTNKLRRSGLASHFAVVEVLPEKNLDAYNALAHRHGWQPETTWMIGNSPKSDINPALSAGLNAVYIPHPSTWVLEKEELQQPSNSQKLMELASFPHLAEFF
jgi:putative hydrolase of the HAD superfamily